LLRRYAADRAWLFAAYVLAVAVLVGFFGLVLSFRGATVGELAGDVAYALLVSVLVLALCLAVDLARWLPAARWLETLRDPDLRLEMPASGDCHVNRVARGEWRPRTWWTGRCVLRQRLPAR